ncbi:MAG: alpha/beta hydrolase [Myxococcales bacterium]|nr:alpha/beta hydrolase [Myxococcales bacterium]
MHSPFMPPIHLVALAAMVCACAPTHTVFEDIDYDPPTGARTRMDVFVPTSASGKGPAVFLVHGGGWETGDKGDMHIEAERLADLGFVTASVGYRLIPEGAFPASSQDISCAWRYFISLAKEHGFAPERVAMMGYSAGGHLVSLHATAQSLGSIASNCAAPATTIRPAAVISVAGVHDLLVYHDEKGVGDYLGGSKKAAPARWSEASPIAHVDSSDPAFLFVHGTDDGINPVEQARNMHKALGEAGVKSRLFELPGGGHLFNPGAGGGEPEGGAPSWSPEGFVVIEDFLYDTVGRP